MNNTAKTDWLRSEIERLEGMIRKELEISFEEAYENYIHNDALTSIITRYKEELLELEKGV